MLPVVAIICSGGGGDGQTEVRGITRAARASKSSHSSTSGLSDRLSTRTRQGVPSSVGLLPFEEGEITGSAGQPQATASAQPNRSVEAHA